MHRRDIIAGVSIAGLMLPEAVAYAGIAGLPPQRALLAAIAGSLVYALAGRSRFAIISPTSSSAAILAAALATMPGDLTTRMILVTLAVGLTGLLFAAASLARLGGLASFVSRPVLRGFAFGLAITIIIKQMPVLTGIDLHAPGLFRLIVALCGSVASWHVASVLTGLAALATLLALRRLPAVPGAFLVLAGGIAASALFDLPGHGVASVGHIDIIPAWPAWTPLAWNTVSGMAQYTLPLVLILFAESWGTMRGLALRAGDTIEPNRELRALGLSNLAAALVQGMPVGAGFSAGSAAEAAGARTRATGAIAAVGVALLMLLAAPMVAQLPKPVLAAVVIAALTHALDLSPFLRLWKLGRDQYVALGAAAGVLLLGVLNGMIFAIVLSLAALIRRLATPQLTRLGRLGDSRNFVSTARHPEAAAPDGMAIWRPAEPLFFANAERILAQVANHQAEEPGVHIVLISLEESFDMDSTALDALMEFDARMRARHVQVRLARARDRVRDLLSAGGGGDLVRRSYYSVDDAVRAETNDSDSAPADRHIL
jgi:MFS superfamily sulfate permease-like transporter